MHVREVIGGVDHPKRLAAVTRSEMHGHLGDADLNAVVATLRIACSVPMAVINIVSRNTQTYQVEVGAGAPCTIVPDTLSFCAEVVDTRAALVITDARAHPVYADNPMVVDGVVVAYAGVPLIDDGFVLGSVSIFDDQPRQFTDRELELLEHQARLASSVLRLRRTARTDTLTGLPNRALFLERLSRSLVRLHRHEGLVAAMYLDVDRFKTLNDSWGHDTGDWALMELARRLPDVLRTTDTFARLGGDEFAAVCEDVASVEEVERIADRLVKAVDRPLIRNGIPIRIELSIGVVVTDRGDIPPASLLRAADAAMYRAKLIAGSAWVIAESANEDRRTQPK